MSGADPGQELEARRNRLWSTPPGLVGWLMAVNHRQIGLRFMVTSFVFFLVAWVEALLLRLQLARPEAGLLAPERFNQLFTMHGSTMMFLFALPFLEGLAIYVAPMMIGTRDMAFPRLNAFGYWVFLIAGVMLHLTLLAGVAPDAGWFNYVPLSNIGFSPGVNIDFWVTMITFLEVAALVAAIELIVTILRQRAPGMTLSRMPLFVWSVLIMAVMIVFAMPPLIVTSLLLALDRLAGTQFFHAMAGGDPLLWQHLFWFFGHPDVYILLMPAVGVISTIIPVAVRRPIVGYLPLVLALVAVGFLSFGLWVHHMYAAGLPLLGKDFFSAASMAILIPNSVQVFAWILTIWRGKPVFEPSFLFALGFLVLLVLGGITGVMVASVPFDLQVHDTYFVVAHFHYVLIGGVVFPIFAAIYHWFPKFTGRMLGRGLGKLNFWVTFVGFNVTFFPMHQLGFEGMPRRVYTYLPGLEFEGLNLVATIGAFLFGLGVLLLLLNVGVSLLFGRKAGPDPWAASTLEWATSSPPPQYAFGQIPVVASRDPLWETPPGGGAGRAVEADDPADLQRETLASTIVDAVPDGRLVLPMPSLAPLWLALAATFAFLGAMINLVLVPIGGALAFGALVAWHWPRGPVRA